MSLVIINSAVDSLYFSYSGGLIDGFFDYLEYMKKEAVESGAAIPVEIGEKRLLLQPYGQGRFTYRLETDDLIIGASSSKSLPDLYPQPFAHYLYEQGHQKAFEEIDGLAKYLKAKEKAKISRIDLCVDFQNWTPTIKRLDDFVCRAKYKSAMFSGDPLNGLQFGKGNVVARIYNKTAEIQVSGKQWMREVWRRCPVYQEEKDVWRVEFQFRRDALTEFGCDTVPDTFERLRGLFDYGLGWLSLRRGSGTRKERLPVDKNWLALGGASFPGESCERVKPEKRKAHRQALVRGAAGYLSSYGAHLRTTDFEKLIPVLSHDMRAYYGHKGTTFEETVLKKIEQDAGYREDELVI